MDWRGLSVAVGRWETLVRAVSQSDTSASCAPQEGRGARSRYAAVRRV